MAVIRNFHLTAQADGQANPVACSPRTKDGGMQATLRIRDNGEIIDAVDLICFERDGQLVVRIQPNRDLVTEDTFADFAARGEIKLETTR